MPHCGSGISLWTCTRTSEKADSSRHVELAWPVIVIANLYLASKLAGIPAGSFNDSRECLASSVWHGLYPSVRTTNVELLRGLC